MNLTFQDAQVLLDEVVVGHYHDQVVNVQDRVEVVRERNGERIALSEVFTSFMNCIVRIQGAVS